MNTAVRSWLAISLGTALALMSAPAGLAATNEVRVGLATLLIPTPEGFIPVSREMIGLTTVLDVNTPPSARRLISFIPEASAAVANQSVPVFERSFHVQIAKDMIQSTVPPDWFVEYKTKTKALLVELAKAAEQHLPPERADIEKPLRELDAQAPDQSIDSVTFPPHQESDRVFAHSGLTRSDEGGGSRGAQVTANTVAAVFVKEKVFMVQVSGGRYDLAWTRTACSNWTAAILFANGVKPSTLSAASNAQPSSRRGELPVKSR